MRQKTSKKAFHIPENDELEQVSKHDKAVLPTQIVLNQLGIERIFA